MRPAHTPPMDTAHSTLGGARRALPLRLYFFASFAALGVYSPFFPRWLVARGIDGVAMGAVVATLPAMGVVAPPLVGICADALGLRGSVLRAACLGACCTFALLAAAGICQHQLSFGEILAVVLLFALFRSPMLMMADVVAVEGERDGGTPYGSTRLWGSVGFLLASVAGGRYLDPESPIELPALVAASLFVALITAFALPERSAPARRAPSDPLRALLSTDLRLLLVAAFVAESALCSHEICFSLYLSDRGAGSGLVGAAWAVGVVAEILMMAAATPLLDRFDPPTLVIAGLVAAVLRCLLLASARSIPALVAAGILHPPSVTLFWVAALAHLRRRTSARTFAAAQGVFAAVTAAGTVTGMLVWGALYRRVGGACTFGVAGAVAGAATILARRWARCARAGSPA